MKVLVTGCAGFIGYHLVNRLILNKYNVVGIDNINNYYDIRLKKDRIKKLKENKKFTFYKVDLKNYKKLNQIIKNYRIKYIIHLAAQAGVRYSIENPKSYFDNKTSLDNV